MSKFKEAAEKAPIEESRIEEERRIKTQREAEEKALSEFAEANKRYQQKKEELEKDLKEEQRVFREIGAVELLREYRDEVWGKGEIKIEEGRLELRPPEFSDLKKEYPLLIDLLFKVEKRCPSVTLQFEYPDMVEEGHEGSYLGVHYDTRRKSVGMRTIKTSVSVKGKEIIIEDALHYLNLIPPADPDPLSLLKSPLNYQEAMRQYYADKSRDSRIIIKYTPDAKKQVEKVLLEDCKFRAVTRSLPIPLEEQGRKNVEEFNKEHPATTPERGNIFMRFLGHLEK